MRNAINCIILAKFRYYCQYLFSREELPENRAKSIRMEIFVSRSARCRFAKERPFLRPKLSGLGLSYPAEILFSTAESLPAYLSREAPESLLRCLKDNPSKSISRVPCFWDRLKHLINRPYTLRGRCGHSNVNSEAVEASFLDVYEHVLLARLRGKKVEGDFSTLVDSLKYKWLANRSLRLDKIPVILAARDSTLSIEYDRVFKYKEVVDPSCRVCGTGCGTVSHHLTTCEMSFSLYKERHDRVRRIIFQEIVNVIGAKEEYPASYSPDGNWEIDGTS
ncbi:hypothetical protein RF11_08446 [Thelohanellus kitauei]|uniref:Uncharacterized protein n=1 Tax=Thelohanellus kitauei TaxID=669202 RepID=A0A0C2J724_THEKT|nr:hypothetical protein RF11_08446 [Thelohanellus kitauei]